MDLKQLQALNTRPPLYEPGTASMWTDAYIARQLLRIHLNPDVDAASRSTAAIDSTV